MKKEARGWTPNPKTDGLKFEPDGKGGGVLYQWAVGQWVRIGSVVPYNGVPA